VVDDKPLPVCDYAGFVPFGMGYRRCPGEQLTIAVMSAFLRKVWIDKIEFSRLNLASPGRVPIGPASIIDDDIAFSRRS
jgi:cytochrome P450